MNNSSTGVKNKRKGDLEIAVWMNTLMADYDKNEEAKEKKLSLFYYCYLVSQDLPPDQLQIGLLKISTSSDFGTISPKLMETLKNIKV